MAHKIIVLSECETAKNFKNGFRNTQHTYSRPHACIHTYKTDVTSICHIRGQVSQCPSD